MADNRAMGVCPACESELEIVDADDEDVVQAITQHCPSCEIDVDLVLCRYPDGRYVGLATALEGDTCRGDCTYDAVVRAQRVGTGRTTWYCARCAPIHYLSAGRDGGHELT